MGYFCNYDRKGNPTDADKACRGRGMILARPKGDRHMINRIRKHCTYHVVENDNWFDDWNSSAPRPEPFWLAGKREPNGNYFTCWMMRLSVLQPGHLDNLTCTKGTLRDV